MKRYIAALLVLVCCTSAWGLSQIVKPYTFIEGTRAKASEVNANFDTVYSGTNSAITSINSAAGSKTSLDARLDSTLNEDGTLKDYIDVAAFSNLSTAKASAVSTGKPLYVRSGTTTTCNTMTIPENVGLVVESGGLIAQSGTLTINGPFRASVTSQAFNGSGVVTFGSGSIKEAYSEWFGAKGDWNGSTGTDDTAAIQKAVNSFRTVRFLRRGYKVTDEITLNPTTAGGTGGWRILGTGNANSVTLGSYLYQATASKAIFKLGDVSGLVYDQQSYIADIGFTGVSTGIGIWLAITEDTVIERCKFSGLARGIQLSIDANTQVIKPRIYNCRFQSLDYGIINFGTRIGDVWIKNNLFQNNRLLDISITGDPDGGYITDNIFAQDDPSVTTSSKWLYLQTPTWLHIDRNHFYNCALTGVELFNPRHCTFSGNQVYRASQQDRSTWAFRVTNLGTEITGYDNIYDRNIFYENYGQAINIGAKADTNPKIINNTFYGTGKGLTGGGRIYDAITVNDLNHATIANNYIDGKEQGHYVTVTTTAGSTSATLVSETGGTLATGMAITGKGIPRNTTVTVSGSSITLSQAATLSVTSHVMTAGNIVTRYGMSLTQTTNTEIKDNVIDNCVNTGAFYSGNRAMRNRNNLVPVAYSTTATVNSDDEMIYVSASSPWTLTLQSAVLYQDKEITILKTDNNANTITVNGGGVNINGSATYTGLSAQYKYLRVKSNGVQWLITGSN